MPIALTIEIPDHIYEPLKQKATQTGQTPEQIVSAWVEKAVTRLTDDPLLQLAGAFESEPSNMKERTRDFGQAEWHDFISKTYGCLADDPIERGSQGVFETRDELE